MKIDKSIILELKHKIRTVCTLKWYLSEMISTAVGDEQQINLAILNADKHSPASSARSTNRRVRGMLMSVGVERSHWQIAKRLCSWASSEARPCQQSCRDGLRMSALLSKKLQKAAWSCLCINIHFWLNPLMLLRQQFLEMIHTDCSAYRMNAISLTICILWNPCFAFMLILSGRIPRL